jgi:hypothetical protein
MFPEDNADKVDYYLDHQEPMVMVTDLCGLIQAHAIRHIRCSNQDYTSRIRRSRENFF